ncbi:Endonuclease/exonuclease/phosphatase [Corchorus olitorius]|uniref:Endonuclease/exonuclease/phosphatase n=1 Tax=Corchorus olitorius TaxID=93759 RepID=A0A1R3K8Z7_9ROSI|nr:Endonuclease/exonuclease/phosphatase [Corchorus olitorius]
MTLEMTQNSLENPDLKDEAIRRDKKKYKKRRAEASPVVVAAAANADPSVSSQAPSHVEGSSDVGFGPWMIVQRKGRRPVKDTQGKDKAKADGEGSDSRIRSNAVNGAGRDSQNRYNPLNGAPLDSGDKANEPLPKVVNKSFKDVKSVAKPEWIPKKEGSFKIGSKSVVKKGQKDKKKVDDCALFSNSFLDRTRASSSSEPTSRADQPPVENPGGEAVKSLTTDPLSLPQQHPPSSLGLILWFGNFFLMSILLWNCRGAANPVFRRNVRELIRSHHVDLLIIVEPKVSDAKTDRIIRSLRFDGFTKVDAVGFSGGIWVLWKSFIGLVNVVEKGGQFISIFITDNKGLRWALTVVYASPTPSVLDFLWNYLNDFDEFDNIPWLLLGDLNQVLTAEEKSGGRPEPVRRMEKFWEVIDRRHLIDLEASGCKFTWSNKQPPGYLIKKKLDRALCNVHWRHYFSDAFVRNFPRAHSDHCPVAISLYGLVSTNPSARPFRFEAAWRSHETFPMVLLDAWNSTDSLISSSYGFG